MPSAASVPAVTSARPTGKMNESRRFVIDDLRHASRGPTPVRNRRTKPIGTIHLLKNGSGGDDHVVGVTAARSRKGHNENRLGSLSGLANGDARSARPFEVDFDKCFDRQADAPYLFTFSGTVSGNVSGTLEARIAALIPSVQPNQNDLQADYVVAIS
jgi:hypothetical protein